MGLLDSFFGSQPSGGLLGGGALDPSVLLAAGLMQTKKGEGFAPLGAMIPQVMAYQQKAQADERANRANDLQQIQGLYNTLRSKDYMQQAQDERAGLQHVRDPMLDQLEQKMSALSGMPGLARGGQMGPLPQQAQQPAPQPQGDQPVQLSGPGMNQQSPAQPQPQQAPMNSQSVPGFGGPAGGQPMAAWYSADPSGKSYMEQLAKDYMEGQKPVINRGYGVGTMRNGRYVPDPSSTDQALGMESGKEDVKAQHEVVQVPFGNRTIPMLKSDWLKLNQGQTPAPSTTITADTSGNLQSQVPPQVQSSRDADRVKILQDELSKETDPANRSAIQTMLNSIQPQQQPRLGVTPDVTTLAGQKAGAEGIGKVYGDAYGEIRKAGTDAPYQAAMLKEMLALTQGALNGQTGAFAPMRQKWTEYLASAGVQQNVIDQLPQTIRNLPEAQDFVKLATQRAMSQTRTMGAREAASVFNQVQAANPNMSLTSAAMQKIIQPLLAEQNWNFAKHQAADQWLQQNNGNLAGFESTWNREHPFTDFWKGAEQSKQSNAPLQANQTALYKARQAIQSGKDPAAVKQRMIEAGFDPAGL